MVVLVLMQVVLVLLVEAMMAVERPVGAVVTICGVVMVVFQFHR